MELDQCSPFNWGFCYEEEGMEELRYCLLHTTLDLETTILSGKEEIKKREDELLYLKDLLSKASTERDEAQSQCQKLMFDNLMLNQQLQKKQNHHDHDQHLKQPEEKEEVLFASHSEEDPKGSESNQHFVTSDTTDENILIASPDIESVALQPPLLSSSPLPPAVMKLVDGKPLPEKGKLLQAVMEAGPLLQTLLLAGPLPQWQHPPPRLDTVDIPPVAISPPPSRFLQHQDSCISINDRFSKKRSLSLCDGSDFCSSTKYQKVVMN